MRTVILAIMSVLVAVGGALAQSKIVYTLELGGDNHAADWEAGQEPAFTSGVTTDGTQVESGEDITWAVRVSVGGVHVDPGGPGDGAVPCGAASLVFSLGLFEADGTTPVEVGAATLACQSGQAGEPGALDCRPTTGGYWSSINDGDADGTRGDFLANAAFARAIHNEEIPPAVLRRLIDPVSPTPSGPNFDYGWGIIPGTPYLVP